MLANERKILVELLDEADDRASSVAGGPVNRPPK